MSYQLIFPGFLDGAKRVNSVVSVIEKEGHVSYLIGQDVFFSHKKGDKKSRRFAVASLVVNAHAKSSECEHVLEIAHRTLMYWLEQYREKGPDSFFAPPKAKKPRVLIPEMVARCNELFAEGLSIREVEERTGVKDSTLRKAISSGVLIFPPPGRNSNCDGPAISTKSERNRIDAEVASGMGTACTRTDERIRAAMGMAGYATTRFERCCDVERGGLLVALPALCANGLLTGIDKHFQLRKGFYSCLHILLTLGFMALGRLSRVEALRHVSPGELGKIVGLDRVPEARTLRASVSQMAVNGNPKGWMRELSKFWMQEDPNEAGYLYLDGHINVYHGKIAHLPRRYVSRDRLCLRGTTDYWVNDALGRPFFVVPKTVTDGLGETLIQEIVPSLLSDVPQQPTEEELAADPLLHRFVVIFDREGSNHKLMNALWKQRIGAITYRKNVKDTWPVEEFQETEVPMPGGGSSKMLLAQRETFISGSGDSMLPVTEVRRLTKTGHQTAIITTARRLNMPCIAGRMFARWRQENYFSYMMRHFDIDGLIHYGVEPIPGTIEVINPAWRILVKNIGNIRAQLRKLQAKLGAMFDKNGEIDMDKNAELFEHIEDIQEELKKQCAERKTTKRKIPIDDLPIDERPNQLPPLNKILTDTVKMISYRAETALVSLLKPDLANESEARAIIRAVFFSSADIEPDEQNNTITIRVHRMATPAKDKVVRLLLQKLTDIEFRHPETGAKMIYVLA